MRGFASDADLQRRAERLNDALFAGEARWRSIRYVTNQNTRWGRQLSAKQKGIWAISMVLLRMSGLSQGKG